MKCPYCGNEMKKGIINGSSRHTLKWVPEEKDYGLTFQWLSKGIKLTKLADPELIAFNCIDCKKLIIDVEDKIDQRTND